MTWLGSVLGGAVGVAGAAPIAEHHLGIASAMVVGGAALGATATYELTGHHREPDIALRLVPQAGRDYHGLSLLGWFR